MQPNLDGTASADVAKHRCESWPDVLAVSFAAVGARAYIAVAGGHRYAAMAGLPIDLPQSGRGRNARATRSRPARSYRSETAAGGQGAESSPKHARRSPPGRYGTSRWWRGPNDDWIDEDGHKRFLASEWKLSAKSDRTGFRLDGPQWTFTAKATDKAPEHGPNRLTSLIKAIRSGPSISRARPRSSWSTTDRAWVASSILTPCHRRRSGSLARRSLLRFFASTR